jgi:hypothetical protein
MSVFVYKISVVLLNGYTISLINWDKIFTDLNYILYNFQCWLQRIHVFHLFR